MARFFSVVFFACSLVVNAQDQTFVDGRSDHGVFVLDGTIYVVGGYELEYGVLDDVITLTPDDENNPWGHWDTTVTDVAPMTFKRGDLAALALDGKGYVFGGWTCTGGCGEDEWSVLSSAEVYDPEENEWSPLPALARARGDKAAVVFEGKLWAIGGEGQSGGTGTAKEIVHDVESFTPGGEHWVVETELVGTERFRFVAGALGDSIYVIGGQDESTNSNHPLLSWVQRREDLNNGNWTWSNSTSLPTPLSDMALVSTSNELLLFGGCSGSLQPVDSSCTKISDKVYSFKLNNNGGPNDHGDWTEKTSMPRTRYRHSAALLDGKVYLIGGRNDDETTHDWAEPIVREVDVYDIANDEWSTLDAKMGERGTDDDPSAAPTAECTRSAMFALSLGALFHACSS